MLKPCPYLLARITWTCISQYLLPYFLAIKANFVGAKVSHIHCTYRISSHKRLGVYYFELLLNPALKGDPTLNRGPALIISFSDSIANSLKFWPKMALTMWFNHKF